MNCHQTKKAVDSTNRAAETQALRRSGPYLCAGSILISADRVRRLDDATEMLDRYGPHARDGLRRVDAMSNCGDIVVLSEFDPGSGEVAAFEDQIGSHGGLGGWQSSALILHPKEWSLGGRIVGAPELHRAIRAWLVR